MSNLRYDRHISLPQVGLDGQRKLNESSVLCIGAGGLGSPILMYLTAAGIGRIGIVDFDEVDLSNLQRQILHSEDEVGSKKVQSAKHRLQQLNSEVEIETYEEMLTAQNAKSIIEGWDLVIDGTDNLPTRYLVDDCCRLLDKPWVYGSIYRFEGQVSVFNYNNGPCYRDLFPTPPPPNSVPSCAEGGVLGILPGVIGSIQATEAIKMILGIGDVLSGRLLIYNSLEMSFRLLNFKKDEEMKKPSNLEESGKLFEEFCIIPKVETESVNTQSAGTEDMMFKRIDAGEFIDKRENGWNPFFLDVRSEKEYSSARITTIDKQIEHLQILSIKDELPKDREIVIHCHSGMRSQLACMLLIENGFDADKLYNLEGGIVAYSQLKPEEIE